MDRNAKLGLRFFAVYLFLYLAFVLTNAFSPATMERTPVAGINLAILCGFGLIITAFVMSVVYGWVCTSHERLHPERTSTPSRAPSEGDSR